MIGIAPCVVFGAAGCGSEADDGAGPVTPTSPVDVAFAPIESPWEEAPDPHFSSLIVTAREGAVEATAHSVRCSGEATLDLVRVTEPPVPIWVGLARYPEGCGTPESPAAAVLVDDSHLGLCTWPVGAPPECASMAAEGTTSALTAVALPQQDWQDERVAVNKQAAEESADMADAVEAFDKALDDLGLTDFADTSDNYEMLRMLDEAADQALGGGSPLLQKMLRRLAGAGGSISDLDAVVNSAGNLALHMRKAHAHARLAERAPSPEWEKVATIEAWREGALAALEACKPLHTRARTMQDVQIWLACSSAPSGYLVRSAFDYNAASQAAMAADRAAAAA